MLVSTIIQDIRNRINDKEGVGDFDDDEIVSYINQALNYVGLYFVTANNPLALKEVTIKDGDTLPTDYIKYCGILPIKVTGKVVKFLDSSTKSLTMKYFYKAANITGTATDEEMPYDDALTNNIIVTITVILLMNQQRLDVTQDQTLSGTLTDMLNSAYGTSS